MSQFGSSPSVPRHPPKSTAKELDWWYERLSRPCVERPIPGPVDVIDVHAYSDASSSVGIGVVIQGSWRAWKLRPGWQSEGRNIAWAEAIAVEITLRCLIRTIKPSTHIKLHCDNKVVVDGWRVGRSRSINVNTVFRRLHELCEDSQCFLHLRHVQGINNPADNPSRGVYLSGPLLPIPALPDELRKFIQVVSDEEVARRLSQHFSGSLPKPEAEAIARQEDGVLDDVGLEVLKHSQIWEQ